VTVATVAAEDEPPPTRPLVGPGRWLRFAPWPAVTALAIWLAVTAPAYRAGAVLAAAAVLLVVVLAVAVLPWRRWPEPWQAVPSLALLPVAMLLEYAAGAYVQFFLLAALPVIWAAYYHGRRMVVLTLLLLALAIFAPPLLLPDEFGATSLRTLALFYALALFGGPIAQHLVSRARAAAAAAQVATRRAEAATRQARDDRDLLNAYLDHAPCLVAVLDRDGRVVLFNRFAERVIGFSAEEMVGLVPWQLSGQAEPARLAFQQVLAGNWPVAYEDDVVTRWGTRRRIAWSATGLVDEHGLVTHSISAGVDITEQRAAEQQAAADRDLLNAYLNHVPCLVVVLDRDRRVTVFNRFCELVSGYLANELLGESLDRLHGDPEGARRVFDRGLAAGGPVEYEGDWIVRDGSRRRIGWSLVGLVDHTGQVAHTICAGVDLTDVRAEQRVSQNVLRAAQDQMIMATDTHGTFTVFNPGAERFLGYTAEEVVGKHTLALVTIPEELAALAAERGFPDIYRLLADRSAGDLHSSREWTLVRKDGTRFPAMVSISTMRDPPAASGEPGPAPPGADDAVGFVAVARDITVERAADAAMREALEREREAADRLRQLDQVRNEFVATVSHDLRTPLTSIVGGTEVLLDAADDFPPPHRRMLESIDRNARRLHSLVADLLLLSRIESGKLRIHPQPVALGEIIDSALAALADWQSTGVRLDVDLPDRPVLVQGDPEQLERVVANLVSNALKFTPPGGQVWVRLAAGEREARVTVSDTGLGIPAEELPRVFDRFFRSSRSQDRDRPGTGLGLTIAKSIMERHGGTVEAAANPERGTTFTMTLPRLAVRRERSGSAR
jgi:PAS domain S-box-containing protein